MIDIGDASKRTGLAPSTLRYYDERGLISSVGRRGLLRTFEESTLAKLTLIELGGGAGFTLDEISTMLPVAGMSRIDRERLRTRGGNRTEDSPACSGARDAPAYGLLSRARPLRVPELSVHASDGQQGQDPEIDPRQASRQQFERRAAPDGQTDHRLVALK